MLWVAAGAVSGLAAGALAVLFLLALVCPHLGEDLLFFLRAGSFGLRVCRAQLTGSLLTVLDRFAQRVRATPDKAFLLYEGRALTYRDVDRRSNRVARVFLRLQLRRRERERDREEEEEEEPAVKAGDAVALLMSNEPDFVCVWFGLAKLGCAVAFLNTNIRAQALLHCLHSSGAKTLVVGADLVNAVEDILPNIQENNISVWVMEKNCTLHGVNTLIDKIEEASEDPVPAPWRSQIHLKSTFLYIFTSGTTGLPKAAVITQLQALRGSVGFWIFGVTKDDIIYVSLPLYHGAASLIGIGGCIELGATLVLKKKFSASQFWNDCRKYNITVFQYIGELCRYLCNQPKAEGEKDHKVRVAVGNGIRTDVWKEFIERFGSIKICEFYGATEGNLCFMNYTGKLGSVGRVSFVHKRFIPYELVKYDAQKEEALRNEHGLCEKVNKGQTGLLISPITKRNPFSGYAGNKRFTDQKLMKDVFKIGDLYFNTGDLMSESHDGFIYFRDRIGDTFRWKGENVATTEVADIIGMLDFVQEVNVYGVSIPGYEGRIGMAAIILNPGQEFDGKIFCSHIIKYLPGYAFPRFIRIQESMEMTGTFKRKKMHLVEEGFNPMKISEPLYFLNVSEKSCASLTEQIFNDILSLKIKL
uniref:long-chain-fatty-acid--CoA ligase n=1 Tax=Callorhinchus milii TaxID=7868 RepID=V9KD18_CALMI